MWILLLSLAMLAVFAYVAGRVWHHPSPSAPAEHIGECGETCGSEVCEMDCLVKAATQKIEYFDDEELDAYKGRPSSQYTDEETEVFRDILYSMREEEVPDWLRSLQLRDIELPDGVKDEAFMMVREQRDNNK
jgi:hypothetical protein